MMLLVLAVVWLSSTTVIVPVFAAVVTLPAVWLDVFAGTVGRCGEDGRASKS